MLPLDLHVLSLSLAFILSQDQTLRCLNCFIISSLRNPFIVVQSHTSFDGIDPIFAAVWCVGAFCALGAAYQAKYHRLAALVLLGGAGITTCIISLI